MHVSGSEGWRGCIRPRRYQIVTAPIVSTSRKISCTVVHSMDNCTDTVVTENSDDLRVYAIHDYYPIETRPKNH